MMKYRLPITIACAALMASGLAVAGEIYAKPEQRRARSHPKHHPR